MKKDARVACVARVAVRDAADGVAADVLRLLPAPVAGPEASACNSRAISKLMSSPELSSLIDASSSPFAGDSKRGSRASSSESAAYLGSGRVPLADVRLAPVLLFFLPGILMSTLRGNERG